MVYGNLVFFKKSRDELAHLGGVYYPNYTETQKTQLIDEAAKAVDVTYAMLQKAISPQKGN